MKKEKILTSGEGTNQIKVTNFEFGINEKEGKDEGV